MVLAAKNLKKQFWVNVTFGYFRSERFLIAKLAEDSDQKIQRFQIGETVNLWNDNNLYLRFSNDRA